MAKQKCPLALKGPAVSVAVIQAMSDPTVTPKPDQEPGEEVSEGVRGAGGGSAWVWQAMWGQSCGRWDPSPLEEQQMGPRRGGAHGTKADGNVYVGHTVGDMGEKGNLCRGLR